MKHRYRNEDGKHVVTIEDDGKVVDRHVYAHYAAAMAARDEASETGASKLRGGNDGRSKPKAARKAAKSK